LLESLDGDDRVLVFSHDDPDGYAAAGILCRYLEYRNIDYRLEFPHRFELSASELKETVRRFGDTDVVFVADKGTFSHYNDLTNIVDPVVVIDHHASDHDPKECLVYNPGEATCAGHQMHQIVSLVSDYDPDQFDDFLALLALRSDWTIQPLQGVIPEFVQPFYQTIRSRWSHLFEPINSRPTWMEINQRNRTLLINQISELYFALSGGGFQYFWNDFVPGLRDRDQTRFGYDVLIKSHEQGVKIGEIESLDRYINSLPEDENVRAIFDHYLHRWEQARKRLKNTIKLKQIGSIDVYFYAGENTMLMPMAGSVRLGILARQNDQGEAVLIMANRETGSSSRVDFHISFRSTGEAIHMGKLAEELAFRVRERCGKDHEISGGGHPPAAEMTVCSDEIEPLVPTRILMELIDEISQFVDQTESGTLTQKQQERATRLGLNQDKTVL